MIKIVKRILFCGVFCIFIWGISLLTDHQTLSRELIRLHVVANSDSQEDQQIKIKIRDAVLASIRDDMARIRDVEEAKKYLSENLPKIQRVVDKTLKSLGIHEKAVVTFCREAFPKRVYETFRLPAGIYHTLRVAIESGAGTNWWCVLYPSVCITASGEEVVMTAAEVALPDSLYGIIRTDSPYTLRFQILDWIGNLKNRLFQE